MNNTRVWAAVAVVTLAACIDTSEPVAPARPDAAEQAVSAVNQLRPLAYVAEVPDATQWLHPVHMADLNGDGRPEILIGSWDTHQIDIYQFDPALKKAVLWQQIAGLPYDINGISSGDVDGDGDVDVLAAIRFYGTFLCKNNGVGSWSIQNLDPRYAWNVQVADIDKDGNLDALGSLDYGGVVLLYGDGAGNFAAGAAPAFVGSFSVGVSDFNQDGLPDLIGPDLHTGLMMAYANLGGRLWSANLGPATAYPYQFGTEYAPSAFDLYGNGNLDQVAVSHAVNGYGPPMTLRIFEGSGAPGSPSWTARTLDVLPYRGMPISAADFDDDGKLDIFVGGSSGALGFRTYRGDGTGNFTAEDVPYTYGLGSRNSFAVVDFNGDGTSDVIATRHSSGVYDPSQGFAILYRVPVFACRGFEPPLNAGPVTVKGGRTLPFKAQVLDEKGLFVPGGAITATPLVGVRFVPAGGGSPIDVGTGDHFAYVNGKWTYDLKSATYSAAGTYTVTMQSGDTNAYLLQPTCSASFIIK